jgi:hypothetical protein
VEYLMRARLQQMMVQVLMTQMTSGLLKMTSGLMLMMKGNLLKMKLC